MSSGETGSIALHRIAILLFVGWVVLSVILWFFRGKLLFHPDFFIEETPDSYGIPWRDASFRTPDGFLLKAWFLPGKGEKPVILFSHGNGGNIGSWLGVARDFVARGYGFFLYDYRGYGESEGVPTEEALIVDGLDAWDALTRGQGISPDRIILAGRSLGGAVAAGIAAEHEAAALVLESTFTSLGEIGQEYYPFLPVRWMLRGKLETGTWMTELATPLLVFHGDADETVPRHHGERLYAMARTPKKRFVLLRGGHNDAYSLSLEDYLKAYDLFWEQVLSGDGDS